VAIGCHFNRKIEFLRVPESARDTRGKAGGKAETKYDSSSRVRKMTERKKAGSSVSDKAEPIDTEEQEKIIQDMMADAKRQSDNARRNFHAIYLVLATMMGSCFVYSALFPFEMEHQTVFRGLLPHGAFQVHYAASLVAFLLCSLIVKRGFSGLPAWTKVTAIVLCCATSAAWSAVFYVHSVTAPTLYWLPLSNLAGVALAIYVDRDAEVLEHDVDGLHASKYEFKKV